MMSPRHSQSVVSVTALAAALLLATALPGCGGSSPSVLLITIDTLRADHLQIYGYARPTAPALAALAARGTVVETMLAAIPETGPAFASMLTGHWPARLGLRGNARPLPADVPTLATMLAARGYDTAAFVSGYPLTRRLCALERGFVVYDDHMPDPRGNVAGVQRGAEKTTEAALAWLAGARSPYFLWVHYYDPHGDYAPGAPYDTMFPPEAPGPLLPAAAIPVYQQRQGITDAAAYVSLYDGEIRRVDAQIERLLAQLGGAAASTLVVATADHGESLTEHGYYLDHGNELYLPSLHVPLILAGPGIPVGRRAAGLARTPDLMPTILELLGVAPPAGLGGVSLAPLWRSGGTGEEAFSEARFSPYKALTTTADVGPKLAVRDGRFTVVLRLNDNRVEAYDRLADPGETHDLLQGFVQDRLAADLGAALMRRLQDSAAGRHAAAVLTPGMVQRLAERAAGPLP